MNNLVIYPGEKLKPETDPFKKLHEFFVEEVNSTDFLIFIGFAFRDEYLNTVIREASSKPKIIIISPHASQLKNSKSLLGFKNNPSFIDASFGKDTDLIINQVEKTILNVK